MDVTLLGLFLRRYVNRDPDWWTRWGQDFCRFMNREQRWQSFCLPICLKPNQYFSRIWVPLRNPCHACFVPTVWLTENTLFAHQELKTHLKLKYIPDLLQFTLEIDLWCREKYQAPSLASLVQMALDEDPSDVWTHVNINEFVWGTVCMSAKHNTCQYSVSVIYPQRQEVWECIGWLQWTLLPNVLTDLVALYLVGSVANLNLTRAWQRVREFH